MSGIKKSSVMAPLEVRRLLGQCSKAALLDLVWDILVKQESETEVEVRDVMEALEPVLRVRGDKMPKMPKTEGPRGHTPGGQARGLT